MASIASDGAGGALSRSLLSSAMYSAGRMSGRVLSICPSLMYVGPSSSMVLRSRCGSVREAVWASAGGRRDLQTGT